MNQGAHSNKNNYSDKQVENHFHQNNKYEASIRTSIRCLRVGRDPIGLWRWPKTARISLSNVRGGRWRTGGSGMLPGAPGAPGRFLLGCPPSSRGGLVRILCSRSSLSSPHRCNSNRTGRG
ncbi:hypothetical protein ACHAWF_000727, partial [Thalassiosira exigua]